ncbi:Sodium/potassium-transporting ATPase subunit beta-2 [Blattella germanica]|nr:Sodium/potassium-transporting ATPase subunit beta-2 [Blattella germanica]
MLGLGFRPMPPEINVESTLIWYRANEEGNYKYWTEELDKFLEVYKNPGIAPGDGKNTMQCDYSTYPTPDKVCYVDPKEWGTCSSENHYSYQKAAPCIFLKLNKLNTVWVSCEGENPADVENIGPIQYIPRRGFPGYFFPFTNTEGYLSPLVAVWFERPATGVLINIECKAWAHNIHHDRAERRGSVHFELMVD